MSEMRVVAIVVFAAVYVVSVAVAGVSDGMNRVRTEAVSKGFGYWDANKEFHWRGEK